MCQPLPSRKGGSWKGINGGLCGLAAEMALRTATDGPLLPLHGSASTKRDVVWMTVPHVSPMTMFALPLPPSGLPQDISVPRDWETVVGREIPHPSKVC